MAVPEYHSSMPQAPVPVVPCWNGVSEPNTISASDAESPAHLHEPPLAAKAKNQNIHVSPAVIEAARQNDEELFQSLRTTSTGLTQSEAEERTRTIGPNEVARERKQGRFVGLLKIIRNPW
jgi:hypothetical protein